ncbi:hypothetical protein NDU88_007805 [Pleurodeles waltl]|uniref:Uncharacterized protein n=1 Tax=Pleurodeles waltl TaxID=8319 RepID=A0AAV7NXD0_PLEWA|nr:hypothetical protein NDU88_007805 [Pleurodeles waltl]
MGLSPSRGGPLPASGHPPLLQSLRPHPARRGQQNGGRSSRLRAAPRQSLCPAARSRPEPPTRGERSQPRIPPQGCDSGAPEAPRNYLRGEPERSAYSSFLPGRHLGSSPASNHT